jgi:hypothetical protein
MRILLRWLVENAWVLVVLCAIGALVYLVRTLGAARERRLAVFTLERETATSRMSQALTTTLIFAGLGVLIYVATTRLLPDLPIFSPEVIEATATPAAGIEPTPTPLPTVVESPAEAATPTLEIVLPTLTPPPVEEAAPTPEEVPTTEAPPTEVTEAPEPSPAAAVSGALDTRFGNFAALVGYSVDGITHSVQQPLTLVLTWQALEQTSPVNLVVFTHLVAQDGHLIAQHDGAPAGGARPTTSWAPGESIVDAHALAFSDLSYAGPATLRVGLYDPGTGDRVLTNTGADYVVLPITLDIVP